jgi:D-serine deaminase-like pyridoxal phosphate-dependent protein
MLIWTENLGFNSLKQGAKMQKLTELINLAAQGDFDAIMTYQAPVKHKNRRLELHREQFGFCAYLL